MPVIRNRTVLALARNVSAFFNLEAGITRPENLQASGSTEDATDDVLRRELEDSRRQLADKDSEIQYLRAGPRTLGSDENGVRPENLVWIFGSARTGSTWLCEILEEMPGFKSWREPFVGTLVGPALLDYEWEPQMNRERFVLHPKHKDAWLPAVRSLVLDGVASRRPHLGAGSHLVIKEPNGSSGAPVLMEAIPESRMILLIRDPRDAVASVLDSAGEGGWREGRDSYNAVIEGLAQKHARRYSQNMSFALKAYRQHSGYKTLVRYEELLEDTLSAVRTLCLDLELPINEQTLAATIEKYSWRNISEEDKGQGKFRRKATPGSWKEDLTPQQVDIVEEITAPLIREFYD